MDWKDKVKEKAADAAQSKAVDSVAKEHGNTAAGLASDGIDSTKTGNAQQFAQKQKLAAQERAREVAERKYSEGKTSAANKVADKYGNTAGQATTEGIDAAREGKLDDFAKQQKDAAKNRSQDAAEKKIEEELSDQIATKNAATKSVEEKRDMLKDMDVSYTSKQTQTQEEMLRGAAPQDSMSVEDKRELLKDMDIAYTSKRVGDADSSAVSGSAPSGIDSEAATQTEKQSAGAKKKLPPLAMAIGSINKLVIDSALTTTSASPPFLFSW